jgi:hypothetical protein
MTRTISPFQPQAIDKEWVAFSGGELEGKRPRVLCADCRAKLARGPARAATSQALCFQCYRAGLERERALKAAGEIETASEARFQHALPFEPVNTLRLQLLRIERSSARASARAGSGRWAYSVRQAQIAARHELQRFAAARVRAGSGLPDAAAVHAAELQLPEAWLPFVVSR